MLGNFVHGAQIPRQQTLGNYCGIYAVYGAVSTVLREDGQSVTLPILMVSGVLHLRNPPDHFVSIVNYQFIPVVAAETLSLLLPIMHIACGVGMLIGELARAASIVACFVFGTYLVSQIAAFAYGMQINCGCFGTSHLDPIGWMTIARTSILLGVAIIIVYALNFRRPLDSSPQSSGRHFREGVTIIELVVVIGIIGILASLTLPAVSAARERARMVQCVNNLRQCGQAAMLHESAVRFYPSNGWGYLWVGLHDRGFGAKQPGGWLFSILPFIEQTRLYEMSPTESRRHSREQFQSYVRMSVDTFLCPSRPVPVINPVREPLDYHFGGTVVDLARVDFAVNAGDISWETYSGPASLTDIHYVWPSTSMASGMSFVRSEVKQSNVLDGASQVIYCGEKWAPRGEQYLGNGFNQPLTAGENRDLHRFTVGPPVGDGDSQLGSISHFGSSHANGCNFVFVDGATHVISYSIHPAVFSKLGNKGDGQSLDLGGIVE